MNLYQSKNTTNLNLLKEKPALRRVPYEKLCKCLLTSRPQAKSKKAILLTVWLLVYNTSYNFNYFVLK